MADQQKSIRIFVVDDEQTIAWTLTTILRRAGFAASAFTKPLEALQAARSEVPDLVVSDIEMPAMSGIDLAIELRRSCPNSKVLLFSGQLAAAGLLETARTSGYEFEFISKPVHPKTLLSKIEDMTGALLSLRSADEDGAPDRTAANMRQSVAELKASIDASQAHKRPARKNAVRATARTA